MYLKKKNPDIAA